jgi:hypothetical protein
MAQQEDVTAARRPSTGVLALDGIEITVKLIYDEDGSVVALDFNDAECQLDLKNPAHRELHQRLLDQKDGETATFQLQLHIPKEAPRRGGPVPAPGRLLAFAIGKIGKPVTLSHSAPRPRSGRPRERRARRTARTIGSRGDPSEPEPPLDRTRRRR